MTTKKLFLGLIFVGVIYQFHGQKSAKSIFSPSKIGFEFSQGNEKSFLFDDPDYFYKTNTLKLQFYYPWRQWKGFDLNFIIQPQHQFVQHQLYNEQFVLPNEENYLEKRIKYTQHKELSITAIEFAIDVKRSLFKSTNVFLQFGLGIAIVDTSTERLKGGFTFLENLNVGLEFYLNTNTSLRMFSGIGHVSNLNFQLPNAGYNIFNTGISLQYSIK